MYRGVGVSEYRGGPWKIGKFLAQMGAAAGRRGTPNGEVVMVVR